MSVTDISISQRMEFEHVRNFACYYGRGRIEDLAAYDMVILQATHYSSEDLTKLAAKGCIVLAYVSVGEVSHADADDRWAMVDPSTGDHACNDAWATILVDCRSQEWHSFLLEEHIPRLLEAGCQGIFLDTVDAHDRFPVTRAGMTDLLHKVRARFPQAFIVTNRGFSIMDTILEIADGIVFEAFTTMYANGRYQAWSTAELAWTSEVAQQLRQNQANVFTIDYAAPDDPRLRSKAERRARGYGFIPFVSTVMLDWLPDLAPTKHPRAPHTRG